MTPNTGKRRPHFKNIQPADPALTPMSKWPPAAQKFHRAFLDWLRLGGYGTSAQSLYAVVSRMTLGYLNKPPLEIDPAADLEAARGYLQQRYSNPATQAEYLVHWESPWCPLYLGAFFTKTRFLRLNVA
jgi:hypothetical protein